MGKKLEFVNKMPININENGVFEFDASLEAWCHYRLIYFNQDGKCNFSEKYVLKEDLDKLVLCDYQDKKYFDRPNEKYPYINRYYLLSSESSYNEESKEYSGECSNISGECDFNFNEKKSNIFKKMIMDEYHDYPRMLEYAMILLNKCMDTHHTLVNFSVMQTKGNMQGYKSKCIINHKATWHDRLDTFISYLNDYFKLENKDDATILKNAKNNKETLKEYLGDFDSIDGIYDYCKKIYLIDDQEFVKRMIKEGKEKLSTGKDVIRYMLLALEYWDRKEKKIKEIYMN